MLAACGGHVDVVNELLEHEGVKAAVNERAKVSG